MVRVETILENIAKEPEVDDVILFLNKMGAQIKTDEKGRLIIHGVDKMHGAEHTVVADRIESGSFMLAAAATRGDVTVADCVPEHNAILLSDLREAGFTIDITDTSVRIHAYDGEIKPVRVRTAPYPGFATDLQAPWMTLMTLCNGTAEIDEDIFENRFMHAPELVRMCARVYTEKSVARVTGVKKLSAAHVQSSDLRGGFALVMAGLCAEGETEVELIAMPEGQTFEGKGMFLCFATNDLEAAHQIATDAGMNPSPIRHPEPTAKYFYVYDPDGVSVQLREYK